MAVNGVSYVSDALKYINGLPVVQNTKDIIGDTTDAVKQTPSFTIFEMAPKVYGGLKYGLNSTGAKGFGGALQTFKDMGGLVDDTVQLQKGLKGAAMNYDALSAMYKAKGAMGVAGSKAAGLADEAYALATEGLATGNKELIAKAGVKANEAVSVAKAAAKEAKPGLFSKLKSLLKIGAKKGADDIANAAVNSVDDAAKAVAQATGTAGSTAAGATAEAAAKGAMGLLGKTGAVLKKTGAGVMFAIEGVMELFTNVIPAFQAGGAKTGVKQLGKSTVKVAASTGGFVGGSMAGKAIGAAIGSIFPGAGTVIGGKIGGFVGGLVGSSLAKGAAEKVTGKSEIEIMQEEAVDEQAAMIAGDSASMNQLSQTLQLAIQQDLADGELSEDGEKMLEYLNSGAFNSTSTGSINLNATPYSASGSKSGLDELVAQIQSGDRSAYSVPTSALEASANAYSGSGYANNYTAYGMTNPYAPADTSTTGAGTAGEDKIMNYFG